jgi:hypothetical protein
MSASSRRQNASLSDVTVSPGSSFSVGPHTSAQRPYPNRKRAAAAADSAEQIRCADMPCHVAGPCDVCHAVGGDCRGWLAHAAQLTWTDRLRLEVCAKHQQLFFHLVHHLRIEPPSPMANARPGAVRILLRTAPPPSPAHAVPHAWDGTGHPTDVWMAHLHRLVTAPQQALGEVALRGTRSRAAICCGGAARMQV